MRKLKTILTLITIAISVIPLSYVVFSYRDNLVSLIIPSQITDIVNGDTNNTNVNGSITGDSSGFPNPDFNLPQPTGEPQYIPQTNTVTFDFTFTNPLSTPITVDKINSGIVTHDDAVFLGNLTTDQPIKLDAQQTGQITANAKLSDQALTYIKTQNQTQLDVDLINLNIEVGGIMVHLDRQNIGNIKIPPQLLG
jgi:hypothetical protein